MRLEYTDCGRRCSKRPPVDLVKSFALVAGCSWNVVDPPNVYDKENRLKEHSQNASDGEILGDSQAGDYMRDASGSVTAMSSPTTGSVQNTYRYKAYDSQLSSSEALRPGSSSKSGPESSTQSVSTRRFHLATP